MHPRGENMKTTRIATYIIGLTLLTTLAGGAKAYAQFEIDPDHFETPAESTQAAKTHYEGKFTLPYTVQCHGRSLPPGKYSVSLDSDGKTGQATLLGKGQAVTVQGIVRRQSRPSRGALVVERTGGMTQLSMIHAAQLDLKFNGGVEHASGVGQKRIETLVLIPTNSRER
jgi:hypothetical protein